jgi:4-hydroxybenzoate polyprenyltransferase
MNLLWSQLKKTARVQAWWSSKFSPLLGTFYATICYVESPILPLIPRLLLLLSSLVVGATYVSVINDWTDLADDLAGGKRNHLADKPAAFPVLVLVGCLLLGLGMGIYLWQLSILSGLLYLGSWVVFSAYSLPPLRLKRRGLAGVLADASGSYFFPQLLAVSLVPTWTGRPLPVWWYILVGVWAFACGVRNILYHQLGDAEADEQAKVNTWVRVRGMKFTQQVGQLVAFPIELIGLALLLGLSKQWWPLIMLATYIGLEAFKGRLWQKHALVLDPNARLLLAEYYEVFYPLGFLLVLLTRQLGAWLVLGGHVLFFAQPFWQACRYLGLAFFLSGRKLVRR